MHHRVKNSLQLLASSMNLQPRRCRTEEAKTVLQENVGRVLSIAAIHDIPTKTGSSRVDSLGLLNALRKNLQALVPVGKRITIRVEGDSVPLEVGSAVSAAMAVNELITNALEHAFTERDEGEIRVSFRAGTLFHTVTVADNGSGFDPGEVNRSSFGLRIVEATVRDKLHGVLRIRSDAGGTTVSFNLKRE